MKYSNLLALLAISSAFIGASPANAQTFPSKPIRIIVPFAVGTALDIVARSTYQKIFKDLPPPF